MSTIFMSRDQFQMVLILLKHMNSDDKLTLINDHFAIDLLDFKNYLFKKAILPLDRKNVLLKNFLEILSSFDEISPKFFTIDKKNSQLILSKNQICLLFKPLITNAAINPSERHQLNVFFEKFGCILNKEEIFIELI